MKTAAAFTAALSTLLFAQGAQAAADAQAPTIDAVEFRDSSIDPHVAPGSFRVKVSFTDLGDDMTTESGSGVAQISLTLSSPNGLQSTQVTADYADKKTESSVKIDFPALDLYAEAGEWTIRLATITDRKGNVRSYSPQTTPVPVTGAISAVVNETSDGVQPSLLAFKVTTSSIKVNGDGDATGAVKVEVADDLSGAATLRMIFIGPGGATRLEDFDLSRRATDATFKLPFELSDVGESAGTWNVAEVDVCDVPGNCTIYGRSTLISLFGSSALSFTVE